MKTDNDTNAERVAAPVHPACSEEVGQCGCCGETVDTFVDVNGQRIFLCGERMYEHSQNMNELMHLEGGY